MEMFRSTKNGGVSVWLSAGEATLLRTLVAAVMELLGETRAAGETNGTGDAGQHADVLDDLDRLLAEAQAQTAAEADAGPAATPRLPEDPVLARLLPDAYADDPEAAGEFRKYTESSLREAKKYFAQTLLDTLPPKGGRVRLTGDQARDCLQVAGDRQHDR